MTQYLKPTDKDAFLDFPKRHLKLLDGEKACPLCYGYGGWNLRINAYPLRSYKNTRKNRHLHCHFRQICYHCHGHGKVPILQKCDGHNWQFLKNHPTWRCYTYYKCSKCGEIWEVDSSD